jgi:hypothetical protein
MKKEIADRWIAALRSGEYAQTQGRLSEKNLEGGNAFCCLGVLCDLYREEHGTLVWKDPPPCSTTRTVRVPGVVEGSTGTLPEAVMDWAELLTPLGEIREWVRDETLGDLASLAELNDHGWSFERIGDFIEKYWEDL